MSTAGKRRAAGPAVTTGHTTGGARKAIIADPVVDPAPTAAPIASPLANPVAFADRMEAEGRLVTRGPIAEKQREAPVALPTTQTFAAPDLSPDALASAASASASPRTANRRKETAAARTVRSTTWVRADQRLALQDAVEALGETFDPTCWSFDRSTLLVTLAHRITPTGGRDVLVISNECYTAWVTGEQDPVEIAGDLFRAAPLARNQITWLLDDAVRHGVGEWTLRPVGMRGWVASRRTRTRRTRHFVVAANGSFTVVASPDADAVVAALSTLEAQRPSR